MPTIDTWERSARDAIYGCWDRLPWDVQQRLDHIRFTSGAQAQKSWASAGAADVDIARLPSNRSAAIGVIAHELGHIAGDHYRRLHRGEITAADAEREANAYARRWGFDFELDQALFEQRRS